VEFTAGVVVVYIGLQLSKEPARFSANHDSVSSAGSQSGRCDTSRWQWMMMVVLHRCDLQAILVVRIKLDPLTTDPLQRVQTLAQPGRFFRLDVLLEGGGFAIIVRSGCRGDAHQGQPVVK